MRANPLRIVILGLSITSSWGNGHATTYRGLIRGLVGHGNEVLFLERDVPWYARNRDLSRPAFGRVALYKDLDDLRDRFTEEISEADLVMIGSYVPEGVKVGDWVTRTARGVKAFYDIDTPVTLAKLKRGDYEYLSPELIPRYDVYLSFTGGPILNQIEDYYGARKAVALYCSFDPSVYHPNSVPGKWDLGYMGTYSDDRQVWLDRLLLSPARLWKQGRFVVAGPLYPAHVVWPENVQRFEHLPPGEHRSFYGGQRFTLNITRVEMIAAGYAPSVRLFEAAACGTPVISDYWEGLETFFEVGKEILITRSAADTLQFLRDLPEAERKSIGERARARVLREHTADHRASQLESLVRRIPVRKRPAARGFLMAAGKSKDY